MDRRIYLANRLREVILNGSWIANTNYKQQLENLDWEQAIEKADTSNSIADLAQHILINVLKDKATPDLFMKVGNKDFQLEMDNITSQWLVKAEKVFTMDVY